ncbi:small conductance mechanosensitive channel [Chishuiella changwenlii]|jgi:small conductance mechanosensitive channel|uniref:Mechanosensitive ion channel protein n=1 Tax=Chishuiella changwenlii TaxID=1434701 RepID=A0A1M6YY03_9FLAO|nr:mechanosensitive ion channel domain-containing protein [Chishuiella changwenlii]GGE87742.1 mechanosensitive ion channel protein [Chishuiella changwenlii]SHL23171.1 small conductance mechanosensitive channel [Chishuiella changwenlii]
MQENDKVDSLKDVIQAPFKDLEYINNIILTKGAEIGWSLVSALLTLFIGFWIAGRLKRIIERRMIARNVDLSIRTFLIPIINIILKLIVVVFVVTRLGLNASGFIAALGGAGLAIGLALQGSLSNFAAGILIIIFKPFKVGDYIVSQGNEGTVESISLLNTVIHTAKGQVITLPNANLFNNPIVNYSIKEYRRLDVNIGISYGDDFDKAKKVLEEVLIDNEYVDQDQSKTVEILEFAASSVNLAVRCYVKNSDYWTAYWQIYRQVKYALDENNISIPYPHTEMIIKTNNESPNLPFEPRD